MSHESHNEGSASDRTLSLMKELAENALNIYTDGSQFSKPRRQGDRPPFTGPPSVRVLGRYQPPR
jgi:hypothetical protein